MRLFHNRPLAFFCFLFIASAVILSEFGYLIKITAAIFLGVITLAFLLALPLTAKNKKINIKMTFCLLCAVSALLWGGRLGGISSANDGTGYELDAIAAVIVGGSSMSGGKATVTGTVAGILILTVISNALVAWGISPRLQECVKGAVIIIAVLSQYRKER